MTKEARRHQQGYVFLKGASWYLRYYDQHVNDDGAVALVQRCRKLADNRGVYRSKNAVRVLADEFLAPFNNGTYTAESGVSVAQFWEKTYLPYVFRQKNPSTVNGYKKMWSRYLKDRMNMPMREVRTVDCEHVLESIAEKYGVNSTTLKHVKHLMSGIFRYAIRTGVLHGVNPVQAVCIPRAKPAGETHAYSLEQILKILAVLPQPARAIVAIASFAGLRKGEIRALRPSDFDGASLKIQRSAWRMNLDKPKGKRGVGVIPLIPMGAQLLKEHLETVRPQNYIFETFRGDPGDLDGVVRKVIRPTLEKARIPWYGLHAFRRGLATNLHELGVADIVIQAILRHSDVAVTRLAYIKYDSVDPRSLLAMQALNTAVCNQYATGEAVAQKAGAVN